MDPQTRQRLAALEAKLERLQSVLNPSSGLGPGVETLAGNLTFKPVQLGFAAELTSSWDATTAYSWKRLELDDDQTALTDPDVQLEGNYAVEITGNEDLTSGTRVWMEPAPTATGYVFTKIEAEDGCAGSVCTDYYTGRSDTQYNPAQDLIHSASLSSGQTSIVYQTATEVPEGSPVVLQAGILAGAMSAFGYGAPFWWQIWGRLIALDSSLAVISAVTTWVPLGFTYFNNSGTGNIDPGAAPGFGGITPSRPSRQGIVAARRTFPVIGGTLVAWQVYYEGGIPGGGTLGNLVVVYGIGSGPTYIITMTGCGSCNPDPPEHPASPIAPPPPPPPVGGSAPVASFTHSPQTGWFPLTVGFVDTSTNTPTSWSWTFGDGGASNDQNPTHTYTRIGTFTVTLTACNAYGCSTATGTVVVTRPLDSAATGARKATVATSPPPIARSLLADFRIEPVDSGPTPLTVRFANETRGGTEPITYYFNFGDNTSTQEFPGQHEYKSVGSYTATLVAIDATGYQSVARKSVTATMPAAFGDGSLTAAFTWSANLTDAGITVTFTDTSGTTGAAISSWAWTFGDGGTSTDQNPVHLYTTGSGTFTVTLTVNNGNDTDTYSEDITIP